eukprot:444914_1
MSAKLRRHRICSNITNHWLRVELIEDNFPMDITKIIVQYALYKVSIRITRQFTIKTDTFRAHNLHIRQLQVYEKLNNKQEKLCKLSFYDGSDSIKTPLNKNDKLYLPPTNCIDGDLTTTNNITMLNWSKDHWMEFNIDNLNIGDINNISRIVIYNRCDGRNGYYSEKLMGSNLHIYYDHKYIAKSLKIQSEAAITTYDINPINRSIPKEIHFLITGWFRQQTTKFIVSTDMINIIELYYVEPFENDTLYVIAAHPIKKDVKYTKYLEYKVDDNTSLLSQDTNFYAHSRTRLIKVDKIDYESQKYYFQVIHGNKIHNYYIYVVNANDRLHLGFSKNIKNAAVFEFKL